MRFCFSWQFVLQSVSPATILAMANIGHGQTSTPPQSTFFSTAAEEAYSTYQMPGDGDLWPSCWADDGNLYAANGDGVGFTGESTRFDMAVSQIAGMPPSLTGTTLATNVGTNWSGTGYNRKPTGMLCRDGKLYLAFQNLNSSDFNDAPAASIAVSTDHGTNWTWDTSAPMFGEPGDPSSPDAYKFTTIFFLDFGKNSSNAIDSYVYAYGLDNNWRAEQEVFLARVPSASVQSRSAWEFYTGTDAKGSPAWSTDITQKSPVLTDDMLLYPIMFGTDCPSSNPVIGQGGVVYDAPLQRYIFTSWSCATHELYEAPKPWGPWSHFLSNDFGPLRLTQNRGQYGTSIPSKFISSDGLTLYLQSNVCCDGDSYTFSLRHLYLQAFKPASPANTVSTTNLALAPGTRAISKSTHLGLLCALNCADQISNGPLDLNDNDFDEESKTLDWWGYTWPQPYYIDQVSFLNGPVFYDGGWYASNLTVQVRQNFQWVDVAGVTVTPAYPYSSAAANQTYTFSFPATWGDGLRILGTPGGSHFFTSITSLGVYYSGATPAQTTSPSFSIAPGTYSTPQSVKLTDSTAGAAIYYTINGTMPTTASALYKAPIPISTTAKIEAIAIATGHSLSATASATYTIEAVAATPVIAPKTGTYTSIEAVTIADKTPNASIHYTTNGTTPTASSSKYVAPITVAASETIAAIAIASGYKDSAVESAAYTLIGSPSVLSAPASGIDSLDATLRAEVNTHGLSGSCLFHYGTSSTALTGETAKIALDASASQVIVSARLTTLKAKTRYYYQAEATTDGGISYGSILSFTTD